MLALKLIHVSERATLDMYSLAMFLKSVSIFCTDGSEYVQ